MADAITDKEALLHLLVLIGFAIAIIFVTIRILWERNWIKKRGVKTEGVVVALVEKVLKDVQNGKLRTEITCYPVIKYKTFMYEDKTLRYPVDYQPSMYKVGDKVTVIYDEKKVERFVIETQQNSD